LAHWSVHVSSRKPKRCAKSSLPQALRRCAVVVVLILTMAGCAPRERTPLNVLFAGSLIVPIAVLAEGHGSIQVIRHVTELHDLVDVVLTADHLLIPALMYQATDAETGRPYADWYVEFATNRLALAYTDQSQYGDEVGAHNWHEIVARPGVRVGLPDPRFDAAGY
jgi:molybdate/tungstate transport system substrate-binding protein